VVRPARKIGNAGSRAVKIIVHRVHPFKRHG
jgi:hypothetical protein